MELQFPEATSSAWDLLISSWTIGIHGRSMGDALVNPSSKMKERRRNAKETKPLKGGLPKRPERHRTTTELQKQWLTCAAELRFLLVHST